MIPLKKWPIALAALVFFIATAVLIGWAFGIETLKSVVPGAITMKANTAFCFALSAVAIAINAAVPKKRWIANALMSIVALVAILTLIEYLADVDLKIDQLLVADPDGMTGRFPPGRLAPITAVCFVCLSITLTLLQSAKAKTRTIGQFLAAWILFVSFQSFVSYVIGMNSLFGAAFFTRMAFHTTIGFMACGIATLSLRPNEGLLEIFARSTSSWRMNRWIVASILFIPPILRVLAMSGSEIGLYDADFATLIQVAGGSALMCTVFAISAHKFLKSQSARDLSQEQVRQSEAKLKALVTAAAQIQWTSDAEGHIVEDSVSWRAYTGQSYDEWKGWGWLDAIHPDDRELSAKVWSKAVSAKAIYDHEYRVRHVGGEWRWMRARGVPLFNDDGTVRLFVGMNQDIHEQKSATEQMRLAKEQAEQASRMKSTFLANMSHEMRTPLGAMIGFADLTTAADAEPQDRLADRNSLHRNGRKLKKLIDDVIELSKLDAGEMKIQLSRVRPEQVLADVVADVSSMHPEFNSHIKISRDDGTPDFLVTDHDRLKEILVNMIDNAVKFSRGREVEIRMSGENDSRVVKFTIVDLGIGLGKVHQERLFEPFFQADASMTRAYGGTGIGLALSRRIARALGGDVTLLKSAAGEGATFDVSVANLAQLESAEAVHEIPATTPHAEASSKPQLQGVRILIVDDVIDNRILMRRQFLKRGALVELAENGKEAVDKLASATFDVILMDIQMPVMDGYEATEKIRAHGFDGPIYAVTAHALDDVIERCRAAGCDEHVSKPVDFDSLTAMMRSSLDKASNLTRRTT